MKDDAFFERLVTSAKHILHGGRFIDAAAYVGLSDGGFRKFRIEHAGMWADALAKAKGGATRQVAILKAAEKIAETKRPPVALNVEEMAWL
jgi:hypothetical protein